MDGYRAVRPDGASAVATSNGGRYAAASKTAICVRYGHGWRIQTGYRSTVVRDSVGMCHLAVLIANPGREIPATELVAGLEALTASAERTTGSGQEVLDREAVRSYQRRMTALSTEIDELQSRGEPERAAAARAERDWVAAELAHATGIGGRARTFPDGTERARIAVGKAIRRALQRIAEADAVIGDHLRQAVHTGVRCCYWPL